MTGLSFRATRLLWPLMVALAIAVGVTSKPAVASDQDNLVDKSTATLRTLRDGQQGDDLDYFLARSKAVLIVPQLVKAGLVFGGEGGSGLLMARHGDGWTGPVFFDVASGSVGLQIGVQVSEAVFVVMTDKGLDALLSDKFTFGGDASIAVATVGAGVKGSSTTNLDKDIIAFTKTKGLFGGAAFDGTVLLVDEDWNELYYGQSVGARGIVRGEVSNPGALELKQVLSQAGRAAE